MRRRLERHGLWHGDHNELDIFSRVQARGADQVAARKALVRDGGRARRSASWHWCPRCAIRRHTARARRWTRPSWTRHPLVSRSWPESPRPSCLPPTLRRGYEVEEKRWGRHTPGHPPRVSLATPHVRRRRWWRRAPARREQCSGRAVHARLPGGPRQFPCSPSPRVVLRRWRHCRLRRRWHQRTRRASKSGVPLQSRVTP